MRIGIISGVIGLFVTLSVHAQKSDSIKSMLLPDVVVTESENEKGTLLELRVAQSDMGKVIGKQGRIAKAIRTVVKAASSKSDRKVVVEILQ